MCTERVQAAHGWPSALCRHFSDAHDTVHEDGRMFRPDSAGRDGPRVAAAACRRGVSGRRARHRGRAAGWRGRSLHPGTADGGSAHEQGAAFRGQLPPSRHPRPVLTACVAEAAKVARVVEFFYADPDPELVQIVHAGGALAAWAIGSREEALLAVEAGCDFIIAQGIEAGGHVRGTIGLLPLLGEVLDTVPVPVLAAGGIGTGRAMAAALAAGADGVRVGTRFAAAEEAGAHPRYVEALLMFGPPPGSNAGREREHQASRSRRRRCRWCPGAARQT
jgi:nitronate monooxygenase